MKIAVIGTGYVGAVTGACLAEVGNTVFCVDKDQKKIESFLNGRIPLHEKDLEDLVKRNLKNKTLFFTTDFKKAVKENDIIFIAVGTPSSEDGSADLSHVLTVAESIGQYMDHPLIIVDKSTVPVGTAEKVEKTIAKGMPASCLTPISNIRRQPFLNFWQNGKMERKSLLESEKKITEDHG